jgi:hypothetical protein
MGNFLLKYCEEICAAAFFVRDHQTLGCLSLNHRNKFCPLVMESSWCLEPGVGGVQAHETEMEKKKKITVADNLTYVETCSL